MPTSSPCVVNVSHSIVPWKVGFGSQFAPQFRIGFIKVSSCRRLFWCHRDTTVQQQILDRMCCYLVLSVQVLLSHCSSTSRSLSWYVLFHNSTHHETYHLQKMADSGWEVSTGAISAGAVPVTDDGVTVAVDDDDDDDDEVPTREATNNLLQSIDSSPTTDQFNSLAVNCRQHFITNSKKNMKCLVAMATGLFNEDGTPFCDLKLEPYCSATDKKKFTPYVKDLAAEIIHWAHYFKHNNIPHPSQWTKDKVMPWLIKYPYTNVEDISFIKSSLFALHSDLAGAKKEVSQCALWTGNAPFMRLIHALGEDDVHSSLLSCHDVMTRTELDARNHDGRPLTFNEVVANKFNDLSYKPTSLILPDLHDDFRSLTDISLENMPNLNTPDQVGERLTTMKSKMILVMECWDKSGNSSCN